MPKVFKFFSGRLLIGGIALVTLLALEVMLFDTLIQQLKFAIVCGIIGALINFLNWRSSEHNRRFTQMYWMGFAIFLIGVLQIGWNVVGAALAGVLGFVLLLYSFKWSPNRSK